MYDIQYDSCILSHLHLPYLHSLQLENYYVSLNKLCFLMLQAFALVVTPAWKFWP